MITLYTGTPGSGKTLHAVSAIWATLKTRKPVVSNIALNPDELGEYRDYYRYFEATSITPQSLYQFSRDLLGQHPRENDILLVLDECQLIFSSRRWRENEKAGWILFMTQHRKIGYDIILITQYDRMIDKQIRTLVEYECAHRRLDRIPWPWSWIISLVKGGVFYCRRGWYPIRGAKIGEEILHVRRKVYKLYDTYDVFDFSPGAGSVSLLDDIDTVSPKGKGGRVRGAGRGGRDNRTIGVSDGVRGVSVHHGGGADGKRVDGG